MKIPSFSTPANLLPLLGKELIEVSAQGRSYLLRVAYACVLFTLFAMGFELQFSGASVGDMSVLGSGKRLLDSLVIWQFIGLYLFLPAMVAPVISSERERGTLAVLLVSRMKPWELLLQKLLSRVIGMGSFMMLALPLGGIAYALGGIGISQLVAAAVALIAGALQVGAWSLYCSVRARSSMAGTMRAYIMGAGVLMLTLPMTMLPVMIIEELVHGTAWSMALSYPFIIYFQSSWSGSPMWTLLISCLPVLLSAAVFFAMACRAMGNDERRLAPHAMQQMRPLRDPASGGRNQWRILQQRLRFGSVNIGLPDDRPIAWREASRMAGWLKGNGGGLWVFLLWFGVMVLLFMLLGWATSKSVQDSAGVTILLGLCYLIAAATIASHASTLISGERSRRTLEILLTTPIEPRDLLRQKLAGVRRLCWLASITIMGLCTLEALLEAPMGVWRSLFYLLSSSITAWLYLEIVVWLSLAMSLRFAGQVQAAVASLATLVAWVVAPLIIVSYLNRHAHGDAVGAMDYLWLLSPASMFAINEYPNNAPNWAPCAAINTAFYGLALFLLRKRCLDRAEELRELI